MPNRRTFPHPVSALWIPALLGIGWLPLFGADIALKYWPDLDHNYQVTAFGMAWFPDIALPCTALVAISVLIQIFRLARWEMNQSEPKE